MGFDLTGVSDPSRAIITMAAERQRILESRVDDAAREVYLMFRMHCRKCMAQHKRRIGKGLSGRAYGIGGRMPARDGENQPKTERQ